MRESVRSSATLPPEVCTLVDEPLIKCTDRQSIRHCKGMGELAIVIRTVKAFFLAFHRTTVVPSAIY